jgi:hypothetical protein
VGHAGLAGSNRLARPECWLRIQLLSARGTTISQLPFSKRRVIRDGGLLLETGCSGDQKGPVKDKTTKYVHAYVHDERERE